ncbi:MAG: toll/interleukin-1 receptor domain-containing protein, partial [Verrucomicrobiota bacterium]|nr:toll/interleukin-1 receptor domain-containing protein [Verrucomicrobiota bacterium]
MTRIFISYRRHDSGYAAASLRDTLRDRFGHESVFFDLDNIPFGVDFREYIGNAVGQCHVLLVLIGDDWTKATDREGKRRLDDPADYVRIEIESALKRDIPVIPVLVEEALMPAAEDLPESIRPLVYRNAAELRAGRDMDSQRERLMDGLESIFAAKSPAPKEEPAIHEKAAEPEPPRARARRRSPRTAEVKTPAAVPPAIAERAAFEAEVRKAFEGVNDSHLFFSGAVAPEKAAAALKTYAPGIAATEIIFLYDNTVYGGAKDGLLLTMDTIFWHNIWATPGRCQYREVKEIAVQQELLSTKLV